MPRLLAIAYHETISVEKLNSLFRSETNQLFAGTTLHCGKCRKQFAVFFPSPDDPDNMNYLDAIHQRILADCKDGQHLTEIHLMRS